MYTNTGAELFSEVALNICSCSTISHCQWLACWPANQWVGPEVRYAVQLVSLNIFSTFNTEYGLQLGIVTYLHALRSLLVQ